ncbi:MAG: sulfatase-like hydrolase/transferase [Bryobacteraceae bacterium]
MSQKKAGPNIVVILADDLGYGDLSCYGAPDIRTPNIDGLAAAGMRLTNFYANSPVCSPTRAALLTGCNPDLVGVPGVIRTRPENSWGYLSPSATLLPQLLKGRGYHSAITGKWHLGLQSPNTPTERGFDFFHGFLGDMMDDYYTHRRHGINYMRRNREEIDPKGHATDLFTQWSIDFLNAGRDGPFFLYAAYNAPHTPIQPTPESFERVTARERTIAPARAKIAALIEHMDEGVGRIVRILKENGQYENTLIVFTSDNGGQLSVGGTAGSLRGGKQDMYEGGIRVPSIFVWPHRIKPGTTSELVAQSSDLLPTLCQAAEADPGAVDGVSVLPSLLGRSQDLTARTLYWVRREGGGRYHGQEYYAVRRGRWKLLHNSPFEPYELYKLDDDPGEQRNLLKQQPKIAQELATALSKHIQRAGRVPWQPPFSERDE